MRAVHYLRRPKIDPPTKVRIKLSEMTWIDASEIAEVKVHAESGTVTVCMKDGTLHHCPNDLGKDAEATALRVRRECGGAGARAIKDGGVKSLQPFAE